MGAVVDRRAPAPPPGLTRVTAPRAAAGRLPRAPGVYRFQDARGAVLYVGRAVELRRRVVSYGGVAFGGVREGLRVLLH